MINLNFLVRCRNFQPKMEMARPATAGALPNTTPMTRCCRKPTEPLPTCAANCPIPKTRSPNARIFCAPSPPARIRSARGSRSRKDLPASDWWTKMLAATGKARLEELAFLFLRARRSVPPELQPHASPDRFARAEDAEQEQKLVRELENWLSPPALPLLDTPRATLR